MVVKPFSRDVLDLPPETGELATPAGGDLADCAPLGRESVRQHVMAITGYCINLRGGVYHMGYEIALVENTT